MSTTGYIYTLNDPRFDEPKYVGATKQPEKRLYQHKHNQQNDELKNWIEELESEGLSPIMMLIDSKPLPELAKREEELIKQFSEQFDLLNKTSKSDYSAPGGIISTTIHVESDTRDRLRGLKVGNETYSELLERLMDEAGYE